MTGIGSVEVGLLIVDKKINVRIMSNDCVYGAIQDGDSAI